MQGAPKYVKIILKWKDGGNKEFEDCGMVVTADKIIIIKDTHGSVDNLEKSNGYIFELSDVKSYETYKKK